MFVLTRGGGKKANKFNCLRGFIACAKLFYAGYDNIIEAKAEAIDIYFPFAVIRN